MTEPREADQSQTATELRWSRKQAQEEKMIEDLRGSKTQSEKGKSKLAEVQEIHEKKFSEYKERTSLRESNATNIGDGCSCRLI